jgi:hypothetical protein
MPSYDKDRKLATDRRGRGDCNYWDKLCSILIVTFAYSFYYVIIYTKFILYMFYLL